MRCRGRVWGEQASQGHTTRTRPARDAWPDERLGLVITEGDRGRDAVVDP